MLKAPRFVLTALSVLFLCGATAEGPGLATGIKIGEVTGTSAIIWVRLTRDLGRVGGNAGPIITYRNNATGKVTEKPEGNRHQSTPIVAFPEGVTVEQLEGAAPGSEGETRVLYKTSGEAEFYQTDWKAVEAGHDYATEFFLKDLQPATDYEIRVETHAMGGGDDGAVNTASGNDGVPVPLEGSFRTAPKPDAETPVSFTAVTGTMYTDKDLPEGFKIYAEMARLKPSFFVHTGDIVYYDERGKTKDLALWHWAQMYSLPTNVEFHRHIPSYFIKDDHETWQNDCWPTMQSTFMGDFTFQQGQAIFLDEVPMGDSTYRTYRWGKDLQIWLPEGRDFRSPNDMPDGPDKSIWGEKQKQWFKDTVQKSSAAFRLLVSPTPIVGPDRGSKNDNHANEGFTYEGDELRQFIASQQNMYVICGDRHWQYVSVDPKTGLREYSCGPASNEHAGGWKQEDVLPEHRYLNVVGGFLQVAVDRKEGKPEIAFRHYGVNGNMLHEDVFPAKE